MVSGTITKNEQGPALSFLPSSSRSSAACRVWLATTRYLRMTTTRVHGIPAPNCTPTEPPGIDGSRCRPLRSRAKRGGARSVRGAPEPTRPPTAPRRAGNCHGPGGVSALCSVPLATRGWGDDEGNRVPRNPRRPVRAHRAPAGLHLDRRGEGAGHRG